MKKQCLLILALFALSNLNADITYSIDANSLGDENNNPLPNSGTIVLVADTSGDGFAPLSPGSTFTLGGHTDAIDSAQGLVDDLVIASNIPHGTRGFLGLEGYAYQTFTISGDWAQANGLSVGDPLALVWMPNVSAVGGSLAGVTISAGSSYGIYSPYSYNPSLLGPNFIDPVLMGSGNITIGSENWQHPGDAVSYELYFYDSDSLYAGNVPSEFGEANFTAIPEPSTYAALLGAVGLAFVGYRRRKNKAAA